MDQNGTHLSAAQKLKAKPIVVYELVAIPINKTSGSGDGGRGSSHLGRYTVAADS